LERLADQGWRGEISSHREEYARSIVETRDGKVAQPLTEEGVGTHHKKNVPSENRFQRGKR